MKTTFALDVYVPLIDINEIIAVLEKPINDDAEAIMTKKQIFACQIYTDELPAVLPEEYRDIDITWLDAGLHWNRDKQETTLKQVVKDAAIEGADAIFIFANGAHPNICDIVNSHGGKFLGPTIASKYYALKVMMN